MWKEGIAQPCAGQAGCDEGMETPRQLVVVTVHQNGSSHPPLVWPTTWTIILEEKNRTFTFGLKMKKLHKPGRH